MLGRLAALNIGEARFEGVAAGVRHVIKVNVRNISTRGQRVRLVPPPHPEFTIQTENDTELAPGLELSAELVYYSDNPKDIETILEVAVGGVGMGSLMVEEGGWFKVPVQAVRPGAKFVFEPVLNFGIVRPERKCSRMLTVKNVGLTEGRISFATPPQGSNFSILPLQAVIGPGASSAFVVEISSGSGAGPLEQKLAISIKGQMNFCFHPNELLVQADVADDAIELQDLDGKFVSRIDFGHVFCGLAKSQACMVVNHGPRVVTFSVTESSAPTSEVNGESMEAALRPMLTEPTMGRLEPGQAQLLTLSFRPPRHERRDRGFVESEVDSDDGVQEIRSSQVLEILETGHKTELSLCGHAVLPHVSLSQSVVDFGICEQYGHRETTVTIRNKCDLPFHFSLASPAHFTVAPLCGIVASNSTADIFIIFKPHQISRESLNARARLTLHKLTLALCCDPMCSSFWQRTSVGIRRSRC
jgi:hypothetical protein